MLMAPIGTDVLQTPRHAMLMATGTSCGVGTCGRSQEGWAAWEQGWVLPDVIHGQHMRK